MSHGNNSISCFVWRPQCIKKSKDDEIIKTINLTLTFVEARCMYTISINQRIKTIKSLIFWLFMNLLIHRHRPQHWDDLMRSFHLQSRPGGKWPILDWHIHEWHMDRQDESRQGQQGTTQSWQHHLCVRPEDGDVLDKVTMERDFHPSLTSKYLVGKVLGEGTTSLVRLGYRREDFNWLIVNYEYLLIPHV